MSVCDWLMTRILISDWCSWDEAGFSWIEAVYTFRQHGYSTDYLIDFSIVTDSKNSSWRVIDIDQVSSSHTETRIQSLTVSGQL